MKFTCVIPHYKTGKMTAYAIWKLLKHKGNHELSIIVVDNSFPHPSINYLSPFIEDKKVDLTILPAPPGRMQSHGIGYELAIPFVKTEYVIAMESDSFPTDDGWLDKYEYYAESKFDAVGAVFTLSGGQYLHPAGTMYKKSTWQEAKDELSQVQYEYFPNMGMREGFPCHLMVLKDFVTQFVKNPKIFGVELHSSYVGLPPEKILLKARGYLPTVCVFHNGMGNRDEYYSTYRFRDLQTEPGSIKLTGEKNVIYRMGYEPGQWFTYWMLANGKGVINLEATTVWMPGRENQQQEYTLTEVGFKHLWGVTAYSEGNPEGLDDIINRKRGVVEELYQEMSGQYQLAL